ncbi:hypothetical protein KBD81_05200 [Candidatus Woesebacteria bacterium]|nr:hypothetical protein [Candidatus Woesebacteria bacterium]
MDPRHQKRLNTVQNLFARTFRIDESLSELPHKDDPLSILVLEKKNEIHAQIEKYAPKYPIANIAHIDLAILQLAIYELMFAPEKQPAKVVINEAVEIAKELGNDRSFAFVNAVLGSILNEITSEKRDGNKSE